MRLIIVVGDTSSRNLGDPILTHCCEYVVRQAIGAEDSKVEVFDIAGRPPHKIAIPTESSDIAMQKTPSRLHNNINTIVEDSKAILKWFFKDRKVFLNRLSQFDLKEATFVIAGGALISSSLFYALRLNLIIEIAKKNKGKVIFNSVGIEKTIYNTGLAKHVVRHYLKQKEVVAFSTRDHIEDIPYLTKRKEFYLQTPDPGLLASEAYKIQRGESNVVGISVISYNAYQSVIQNEPRAKDITPDSLIEFWASIIKQLQDAQIPFRILTNGGIADYEMALRLADRMQLNKNLYLQPLAQTPEQLVSQLSKFSFVIAHRLHACIISTSLGLPIIPVIWSDKVSAFAKMINNLYYIWPGDGLDILRVLKEYELDVTKISSLKRECIDYINTCLND